ncbi:MAG: LacI family DNA-binding transcriptional regulator [Spirochaetales bacterium]
MMRRHSFYKRITIKDVAQKAGVSVATVSRVINKNYYVSPEVAVRVNKAIEECGYLPDSIARSLKNNTTYLIGFIVSDISNPHLMSIARAIENVIRESNYNLLVCSTENDPLLEKKYIDAFLSRRISGIILHSTGLLDDYVSEVSQKIPITLVYRRVKNPLFKGDFVDTNGKRAVFLLTQHLIKEGHTRIGAINGSLQFSTAEDRDQGYRNALKAFGIPIEEELIYYGDFTDASGYQGAATLMSLKKPPSAIVCMNNVVACGALKYLFQEKIRVPEDVSVVNYGEIENVETMKVILTRVPQDPRSLGNKAGELILSRINNPILLNREVIFDSELILGNSTRRMDG